ALVQPRIVHGDRVRIDGAAGAHVERARPAGLGEQLLAVIDDVVHAGRNRRRRRFLLEDLNHGEGSFAQPFDLARSKRKVEPRSAANRDLRPAYWHDTAAMQCTAAMRIFQLLRHPGTRPTTRPRYAPKYAPSMWLRIRLEIRPGIGHHRPRLEMIRRCA